MDINLTLLETRILGSLIEKEITTPDQYPLSLNALTNACNQKSNRDPVLSLDEATVQQTVDDLIRKHFVIEKTGFGSRVPKFQQRFCNTEFGELQFTDQELGVVCVLFLRGPQTPGELRTRTNRLCKFSDVNEVESTLNNLTERDDGPFVVKLPLEAGKRESRYAHLFSGEVTIPDSVEPMEAVSDLSSQDHERLTRLEQLVNEMRDEIDQIKHTLEQLAR